MKPGTKVRVTDAVAEDLGFSEEQRVGVVSDNLRPDDVTDLANPNWRVVVELERFPGLAWYFAADELEEVE